MDIEWRSVLNQTLLGTLSCRVKMRIKYATVLNFQLRLSALVLTPMGRGLPSVRLSSLADGIGPAQGSSCAVGWLAELLQPAAIPTGGRIYGQKFHFRCALCPRTRVLRRTFHVAINPHCSHFVPVQSNNFCSQLVKFS